MLLWYMYIWFYIKNKDESKDTANNLMIYYESAEALSRDLEFIIV